MAEDKGRHNQRWYSANSEQSSLSESRQATLRGGNAWNGSEKDPLLPYEDQDGGGTLRRQGATKLNFGSIRGGVDVIKLADANHHKHLKRYDDKNSHTVDEQDIFLEKTINNEESAKRMIEKYSCLKKFIRAGLFGFMVSFLLLISVILNAAADNTVSFSMASASTPLIVNITSGYIYLLNNGSSSSVDIKLSAVELLFTPSIIFQRNKIYSSFQSKNGASEFTVSHKDQEYACKIAVTWPKGIELSSLHINCDTCTIIARSGIKINQFTVTGHFVTSNFKQLETTNINYSVVAGMAQFNEAVFNGDSTFNVSNGSVSVQSRSDFKVNLQSANNHYCVSAPFVESNSVTCATQILTDDLLINLYNISSYEKCTGSINLCKTAGCSPLIKITIETLVGNFYCNLLDQDGSIVVSDQITTAAGSPFFKNVSFNPGDLKTLSTIVKSSDPVTSLPLILRVDVGNNKADSSDATKWIVTEYPLNSIYDPWMVSSATFGIFTTNFKELSLFLSPGFCPYRPILNRKQ